MWACLPVLLAAAQAKAQAGRLQACRLLPHHELLSLALTLPRQRPTVLFPVHMQVFPVKVPSD